MAEYAIAPNDNIWWGVFHHQTLDHRVDYTLGIPCDSTWQITCDLPGLVKEVGSIFLFLHVSDTIVPMFPTLYLQLLCHGGMMNARIESRLYAAELQPAQS